MASSPTEPVAIVGASGALGFGLAVRLGSAGVPIAIGSRNPERAAETLERASAAVPGGVFSAYDNEMACGAAQTVILSVPFRNQAETLGNLKRSLRAGQLLIDATVPLAAATGGRATRMLGVWQGSAAQQAAEMARTTESLTALLISVNTRYKVHAGIRLTGLPDPAWDEP